MFYLQEKIKIENLEFEINTDFRIWLKFQKMVKELKEDEESVIKLLSFFSEIGVETDISFFKEVLKECISFFVGENTKNNINSKSKIEKVFDFEQDEKYIYSAFLQEYGIDLYSVEKLHWHKFKSLLESLSDNCQLSKIIQYRSIDLSKIKDKEQKKHYKKLKEIYSLKNEEVKIYKNLEEANDAFLNELERVRELASKKVEEVEMNG